MFSLLHLDPIGESELPYDVAHRQAPTRAPGPAGQSFCLVLHGVSPATWPLYRSFVAQVEGLGGVPMSLLVSPAMPAGESLSDDPQFCAAMDKRLIHGDELVLHGFGSPIGNRGRQDMPKRTASRGCGRMPAPLPLTEREARSRLAAGLRQFLELDWPVTGFVAPGWRLCDSVRVALGSLPFHYTADRECLIRLEDNRSLYAPAAIGSDLGSTWRKVLSTRRQSSVAAQLANAPCLRLVVHPMDLQHAGGRDSWLRNLNQMLTQRAPLTLIEWLMSRATSVTPNHDGRCSPWTFPSPLP